MRGSPGISDQWDFMAKSLPGGAPQEAPLGQDGSYNVIFSLDFSVIFTIMFLPSVSESTSSKVRSPRSPTGKKTVKKGIPLRVRMGAFLLTLSECFFGRVFEAYTVTDAASLTM